MTPWEIKAVEFSHCNCNYGCPCQFNAPPTYGNCDAVACLEVTEGHHGDVDLKGLRFGGVYSWPKAIHDGNGRAQAFVDDGASEAQRNAVLGIMMGQDTAPMATMFAVFASTLTEVYDPIFAPVDFSIDVNARTAHFFVPGVVEAKGEPIKNPITGEEHRARIDLPNGFEYEIAEMGSGTSTTHGRIELSLKDSYGQFAHLHLNNDGVVRHRSN
jgi:hypothetical protein